MNLLVVIPAYNTSSTIGELLSRTVMQVPRDAIVVVDDGSNDSTAEIASRFHVRIERHAENRGKGSALKTGFNLCKTLPCDAVITMDADLQHAPESIPRFIRQFTLRHRDIIIGSRLHNMSGMPLHRRASNILTTFLVRARTGVDVCDSQSGFRLIARRVLEEIALDTDGYEAETEFLIKAAMKGFSIDSIPIDTIYAGEQSHMTHVRTTVNFIKTLFRQY
jgi:glycosyltransferase involved in cell wall biosynthesis